MLAFDFLMDFINFFVIARMLCFRANPMFSSQRPGITIVEISRISKIVEIFRISPKIFRKFWKTSRKIFCKKLFSPLIKFYTTPRVSTILQTHSGYLPDKLDDRNQFFFWPGTDFPSKSLMVITLTGADTEMQKDPEEWCRRPVHASFKIATGKL